LALDDQPLPSSVIALRLREAYEELVALFRRGEAEDLAALAPFPPRA